MMRAVLVVLSIVLVACSAVSPPPQPPPPGVGDRPVPPGPLVPRKNAAPLVFPTNFTIIFTREYGMWKYRTCTLQVNLFPDTDYAALECVTTGNRHVKSRTDGPGFDAIRLRQLAQAADLYESNHIGEDMTPADGTFETLRFRPAGGGPAVVLVTSGNKTFEDRQARRDLLQLLNQIGQGLREKAELASLEMR